MEGLLGRLVASLLAKSDNSGLHILTAHTADKLDERYEALLTLPDDWARQTVDHENLISATQMTMNAGANVLLLPPWGRQQVRANTDLGRGVRNQADIANRRARIEMQEEVLLGLSAPENTSRLFVLLPASTLTSESSRVFRSMLLDEWQITDAVFFPGQLIGVHPAFHGALLALVPRVENSAPTKFFDVGSDRKLDSDSIIADFGRLQRMLGGETELGYVYRGDLGAGESLAYTIRDPKMAAMRDDLAAFGGTVALHDIFAIKRGQVHMVVDRSRFCPSETPEAVRVISARDLLRDGSVREPAEDTQWIVPGAIGLLAPGDLLVRNLERMTDSGGFTVAQAGSIAGATANDSILVLSPHAHISAEVIDFVVAYLRSPSAKRMNLYRDQLHLGTKFGLLAVPVPDEEILTALRNLRSAQSSFLGWADEARRVIESVFDFPSIREARPHIIEAGRNVRWRNREARKVDDPDFTVRSAFPYPVASRWRAMEAALSGASPGNGYAMILDTAEALLAFLSQVVFAMAQQRDIEVKSLAQIRRKLQGGSGPGIGEWAAVLQETTSKHFKAASAQGGLADIIAMFSNPDVEAARVRLSNRRNDEAHNRRIESVDLEEASEAALTDLRLMTKAARFLVDMPLRHVTHTSWDSFARKTSVTYREMVGDHWVVKSKWTQVASNEIEIESLYVVDPEGHWHLMRPFLVVRNCPHCRAVSTFHVDAVKGGEVRLKSLENGHTIMDHEDMVALQQVGLI